MSMDNIQKKLLEEVAGLHEVPQGAYSLTFLKKIKKSIDFLSGV